MIPLWSFFLWLVLVGAACYMSGLRIGRWQEYNRNAKERMQFQRRQTISVRENPDNITRAPRPAGPSRVSTARMSRMRHYKSQ